MRHRPTRSGHVLALAVLAAFCFGATAQAADPEQAQYNAVVSLYNAGQWRAALSKIEEREKLTLSDAMRTKYLFAKALAHEKGSQMAEARAAYEQVVARHGQSAEAARARLAVIYLDYAQGKLDTLPAAYEKLDKNALAAAERKNLALIYAEALNAGTDHRRALDAYQAAIAAGADAAPLAAKMFALRVRLALHADVLAQSVQGVPGVAADRLALIRAESLLALSRFAEAEAEAKKVPSASELFPRASFACAQALIKQAKLKEAVDPLRVAIERLKDPPAPLGAHIALAECLLAAGQTERVDAALDRAIELAKSRPAAERSALDNQFAVLRVRAVAADPKKLIETVTALRGQLPQDQRAKILYMRLDALAQQKRWAQIAATLEADLPALQSAEEYGPAALIYYKALSNAGRQADGVKLLDELIVRKADAPDAIRARVALAGTALEKKDYARATDLLAKVTAAAAAPQVLGKQVFDESTFNLAVALSRLNRHSEAAAMLTQLVGRTPPAEIASQAYALLGQAHAAAKNLPQAVAAWKQALAGATAANEVDLRDRLARAQLASGDPAGANEQYEAAAKRAGGAAKLSRESREVWARAMFAVNKYRQAAELYDALAADGRDAPRLSYEAAVAYVRAGDTSAAMRCYGLAAAEKSNLPADYAHAVDANLARLRLETGQGDMGLGVWLEQARIAKDEPAFEQAAAAVRKAAGRGKLNAAALEKLEKLVAALPADSARRYALGSLLVEQWMLKRSTARQGAKLAEQLAGELAQHESKLDAKSSGATIGAAMIYYYRGEAKRAMGRFDEALAAYETVLASYPYNDWPDAAACGAAECYLELGDHETAVQKLREVTQAQTADDSSARWRKLAERRLKEIQRGN